MGFMSHGMQTTLQNRALLKKRKSFKEIRKTYNNISRASGMNFKELTEFEKKKIKNKIIKQIKIERQKELMISCIAVGATSFFILLIYWWVTS